MSISQSLLGMAPDSTVMVFDFFFF